jgi:hypothetical protein
MRAVLDIILFILFLTTCFSTTASWSQSSDAAALLLGSQGARGVALGESYVAAMDGIQSIYWNPAGLLTADNRSLQFSYSHRPKLAKDYLNYEYGAIGYQSNAHSAIAANFSYVDFGPRMPLPEHSYSYSLGVSIAHLLAKGFAAGITIKRITQKRPPASDNAFAVDFGLLYQIKNVLNTNASQGQLNFGASLSNVGEKTEYFEDQGTPLPRVLRAGFVYQANSRTIWGETGLSNFTVLFSFEYQNFLNEETEATDENIWEWGGGVELRLLELIAFRLGYHERHPITKQTFIGKTFETGGTFGFGLNLPFKKLRASLPLVLQFDYAKAPQNGFVDDYQIYTFAGKLEF